ncbi:MAG: hypothetical protein WKG06_10030 [Segetibacter sp.]
MFNSSSLNIIKSLAKCTTYFLTETKYVNGGTIENKGFELILSYQGNAGPLKYGITLNGSTFKNKILYLPNDVVNNYGGNGTDNTILGHSITSVYGYISEGIFQNQKEVDDHAKQSGAGIGRLKYKDINNDSIINEKDQDWIGTGVPKYTYGANIDLQYKSFSLNMFFQGVTGIDIYNNSKIYTDFSSIWIEV